MDNMSAFEFEGAMTKALMNALAAQSQKELAMAAGSSLMDRLFKPKDKENAELLVLLEIEQKKRSLGLPSNTAQFEELLNEPKTLLDPGRAIALGSIALWSKAPLFKLGANPFFRSQTNAGKSVGSIAKYFR